MNISRHRIAIALAFIVVVGTVLRFQAVLQTSVDTPIRADAAKYALYAYNLKNHGVYSLSDAGLRGAPEKIVPDARITPGYPLFLALFMERDLSPRAYLNVLLTQALLSALTVLFTHALFARAAGQAAGLGAALLTALSPHLVNMNVYLLTETLFCFLLVAALAALASEAALARRGWLVLSGLLLGAATLTRPWVQGYAVLLCLWLALAGACLPRKRALWLLAGFAVPVAPWVVRNLVVLGIASDPTLSLVSIYHGSFPDMMLDGRPETLGFPYRFDTAPPDTSSFAALWPGLAQKFHAHPLEYLRWYLVGKPAMVFSWNILGGVGDVFVYPVTRTPFASLAHFRLAHDFMRAIHGGVTVLGLLACLLVWLPRTAALLGERGAFLARAVALLVFYFIVLHVIGAPFPRYAIPLRPFVYGMAATAIAWLAAWWRARRELEAAP